jgi:hypothetical protein
VSCSSAFVVVNQPDYNQLTIQQTASWCSRRRLPAPALALLMVLCANNT